MKSRLTTLLFIAALLAPAASEVAKSASGQGVRGPVLGYVFDGNTRLLRPINGIAGAAYVAAAIDLGFVPTLVEVSPNQDYALALDSSGQVRLVDLSGPLPTSTIVNGALAGADRIFVSPAGLSAALYDRQTRRIQLLEGLPRSATAGDEFEIGSLPGVLTALAVSDRGDLLAAVAERSGGSLYAVASSREPTRIGPLRRALSVAFLPRSNDALVADYDAGEILLVRNAATVGQVSVIASAADGVSKPRAVAASADGTRAVAAIPGGAAVIRLTGGAPVLTECACTPTTLSPLAGGAAFRLTASAGAPIHLIEVGDESRMLFVPAAQDAEAPEVAAASARTRRTRR